MPEDLSTASPAYEPSRSGPSGPRAGFWRRAGASFIDGIPIGIVAYIGVENRFELAGMIVGAIYFTIFEGTRSGQTLGKKLLGIRVIDLDTGSHIGHARAALRFLARFPSDLLLGLGYLWMLWHPEKMTWHDLLSDSVVVPVEDYPVR